MKTHKLSAKQIIGLFLAGLVLFASMACNTPADDYGCPTCTIEQDGGF